jgi:two-component system OmpR family response regulator
MTHILVVDDDPAIRELLDSYLGGESFSVSVASCGVEMHAVLDRQSVDLILLDLRFPNEDGLTLAAEIKAKANIPIIMLTGRSDVVDRSVGLEVGADDYVTKPFHLREVLARVKSVLRRTKPEDQPPAAPPQGQTGKNAYRFAGWTIDLVRQSLTSPEGQVVTLTSGDFRLLEIFVRHPRQVFSRDRLLDLVAGREMHDPFDRSIDTRIRRLRLKIERNPAEPELIKTVRSEGYVFAVSVESAQNVPS